MVIVESPAKSKTIEKYLGSDYQVLASFGHVRDLPKKELGVDVDHDFEPKYIIPTNAKKTVTALKKALVKKDTLYIATDLDREGEAIGWHVVQALGLNEVRANGHSPVRTKSPEIKRITFHEITKSAILDALKHPRQINKDLVDAQQARRVLDRLVGYTLSPFLWKKLYKGLSAGRVQSVALRLIVERERERQKFKPTDYWTIHALLKSKKGTNNRFVADLISHQGKKLDAMEISSAKAGEAIIEKLNKSDFIVESLESSSQKRYAKPPYTTSTLQQDSVNRLNFSAKKTMMLAQRLYEAGLITYMRTDSVQLSADAQTMSRKYIDKTFGQKYLPEKPNYYQTKSKGAQEAHEAIHPTDLSSDPGKVSRGLEPAQAKLYDLIWKRTMASQMTPAELARKTLDIKASDYGFRAVGSKLLFPGFLQVWGTEEVKENEIPDLAKGEKLDLLNLSNEKHTTEPPARFTEAKLVKTLEELGIGRPSTYAPTIDTLVNRNYIHIEAKQLVPEEVGFLVVDLLVEHFADIVDFKFTADMEEQLDDIAEGKTKWQPVIKEFWSPFSKQVAQKTKSVEKVNSDKPTDEVCEKCGKPMVEKMGRFGRFLACSAFPECKSTKNIVSLSKYICPVDGAQLSVKGTKKRKTFFGCPNYPKCDFAIWKPTDMAKKIEELKKEKKTLKFEKEALDSIVNSNL